MINLVKNIAMLVTTILFITFLIFTPIVICYGIVHSDYVECQSELKRIDYVFPAFRFGCYLGGVPSKS